MKIGYARVSTADQNADLQRDALKAEGCERIYEDRASGKNMDRPEFKAMIAALREGDQVLVWKLDRLGRNTLELLSLFQELDEMGVSFRSVTDGIDTSGKFGRLMATFLSAIAEMERDNIRERTAAGLAAARARGRVGGAKPKLTKTQIEQGKKMWDAGMHAKEIAGYLGVSRSTLYRLGVCTRLSGV